MWLGFDIGGTKLAVVVGDSAGRIAALLANGSPLGPEFQVSQTSI